MIIKFQTSHDILNDMNLLKEYLNKKNNVSIFPHTEVTIAPASLKPEYQIYIDLYVKVNYPIEQKADLMKEWYRSELKRILFT